MKVKLLFLLHLIGTSLFISLDDLYPSLFHFGGMLQLTRQAYTCNPVAAS